MFSWFSRCWGGMGVNSQFQRARIRSIITDWKVPDDADVCILINSFKGENPQIQAQTAINTFFSHMETDDQKNDHIFLLKHLYILDQAVEERVALDTIASYYSSEFFSFKTGASIEITPIRELIASYFIYIKKKAEMYSQMDFSYLTKKQDRKKLVEESEVVQIFSLVDKCFQIQKAINQVNTKYQGRNKAAQLIQMIFTMLLKTYLFCYTLVSTCARVLFKRLGKLNRVDLGRMYHFILFFNKQYTRNFVNFIQSNKQIAIYRNIKYSELIKIDKSFTQYLQNLIKNMDNQPVGKPEAEVIIAEQENKLMQIPEDIMSNLLEELKVVYRPRKLYVIDKKTGTNETQFYNYTNHYSQQFDSEFEVSLRHNYIAVQNKMGSSTSPQNSKIINIKKVQYNHNNEIQFNQAVWNQWNNIYAI